jgi:hypothetical protein
MGERAAGLDAQVTPDVRFWHSVDSSRADLSPTSLASVALATRRGQPYSLTGPRANPMGAGSLVHWRELVLRTWNSPDINVYISTGRSPGSTDNWVIHCEPD